VPSTAALTNGVRTSSERGWRVMKRIAPRTRSMNERPARRGGRTANSVFCSIVRRNPLSRNAIVARLNSPTRMKSPRQTGALSVAGTYAVPGAAWI
jgi:hypothetical protein